MEISNDNELVHQEFLMLNEAGWLNFAAEYTVYGPKIGVVIYHPPTDLDVDLKLYAGLSASAPGMSPGRVRELSSARTLSPTRAAGATGE